MLATSLQLSVVSISRIGIKEYFQYDPTGDYLNSQLKGSRLIEGQYCPIPLTVLPDNIYLYSQVLGLDLRLIDRELRFFNAQTGKKLLSHKETEQARLAAIPRLLELGLSTEQIANALGFSLAEVESLINHF